MKKHIKFIAAVTIVAATAAAVLVGCKKNDMGDLWSGIHGTFYLGL